MEQSGTTCFHPHDLSAAGSRHSFLATAAAALRLFLSLNAHLALPIILYSSLRPVTAHYSHHPPPTTNTFPFFSFPNNESRQQTLKLMPLTL